jgi:hypothetical protein
MIIESKRGAISARRRFLSRSATLLAVAAVPMGHAQSLENRVTLSDFGGLPGANSETIISAFNQAFNHLKSRNGGELTIPPGIYDLGNFTDSLHAISVQDLENVVISGYGATFEMTTVAMTVPVFISFLNPSNVTVKGLTFYGHGTNLLVSRQGAVCIAVYTTRNCSGFKTVDCVANNVLTFFRTDGDNYRYTLTGCDIHASIANAYYGVNANWNGSFSKCAIFCSQVKRGFIGYGAKNWDIEIRCTNTDRGPGSNGFICLIPFTDDPSENCNVNLIVTGSTNPYRALVHFYHQGAGGQYIRNVTAKVTLDNATGRGTVFLFDYETAAGVQRTTTRTYENVILTGTIVGTYQGRIIENPSVSSGSTNDIKISSELIRNQNTNLLPKYITTFVPS